MVRSCLKTHIHNEEEEMGGEGEIDIIYKMNITLVSLHNLEGKY